MSIAPLVILFVIFYFLLIRPQQKKAKEHKQMLSEVQKGDNVVTNSGIYGRVISVQDETLTVEIAENVKVKVAKEAIAIRKPQS
ncbi:MAG: preprotein translocase subunit YajC [Deltaproteobacteria bacterium]|nr:preprotein translocase subunit YajC [Deltaproteobacteria bacterium]HAO93222.1 preprotein translocase subunit YajC [Deltaproteobacteria bacterium]